MRGLLRAFWNFFAIRCGRGSPGPSNAGRAAHRPGDGLRRRATPGPWVPSTTAPRTRPLVMRRAAALYPEEAKTDRRDAYVLADTGRTRRKQVHWLDAIPDELLASLRVLNGDHRLS